jgi:hypothetical protein
LEADKKVKVMEINNDETNFSHLYYRNRNDVGSLLDLREVTSPFGKEMNKKRGTIHWLALEYFLQSDEKAVTVKKIISEIENEITDHMPVLTRFGVKN